MIHPLRSELPNLENDAVKRDNSLTFQRRPYLNRFFAILHPDYFLLSDDRETRCQVLVTVPCSAR